MDRTLLAQKTKYLDILRKVNILHGLTDAELEGLLLTENILFFHKKDPIFEQESIGNTIYIVLEGSVSLLIDPEKVTKNAMVGSIGLYTIGKINAGESFGELSLFDQKPRSVSAIAAEKNTALLTMTRAFFEKHLGPQSSHSFASLILQNIIKDISTKLRNSNRTIIDEMLSVYFIKVLIEELQIGIYECTYVNPLKKQVVVHQPEHFVLSRYVDEELNRKKELIDIYFLTDVNTLKEIVADDRPSGEVIANTLLTIIRCGKIPARVGKSNFEVKFKNPDDFRKGQLKLKKNSKIYYLNWELKGIIHVKEHQLTYANLFLSISENIQITAQSEAAKIIKTLLMPIQNKLVSVLPISEKNKQYHAIVIHHRTNEVINTVEHLKKMNYKLDAVIGIPYGEVDWKTIITLDYASDCTFQSLKTILDRKQPTKYVFDFKASSFLALDVEKHLLKLFDNPQINGSYLNAMEALVEYNVVKSLRNCIEKNEKLIVFEDGGYIANIVYRIYHNPEHPLYVLIKRAVDEHILVGIVEGTMSGERVHRQYLKTHENKALLPVLSTATSQLKILFESKGIAESIIYAASTALGRMGLPAFQERRIVVIGGNGTIGRRVIEQLTTVHNSTSEIMVVDVNPEQPLPPISDNLSYLKERIRYSNIYRYNMDSKCDYFWLPYKYNDTQTFEETNLSKKINGFINNSTESKLLLMNYNPGNYNIDKILHHLLKNKGINYQIITNSDHQITYHLTELNKDIILLSQDTVITINELNDFINNHIDTVIGVTGVTVIHAKHIVNFLLRENLEEEIDQIVFISGSSKDSEFKQGIAFLDYLVYLCNNPSIKPDKFDDELKLLFNSEQLIIPKDFKINKYIHPDVGMSFNIEINGRIKILHMLANGLVINFFAKHEKGAKSEYIDPIVTLQLLSFFHLAQNGIIPPALYDSAKVIGEEYNHAILAAINEKCKPMFDSEP